MLRWNPHFHAIVLEGGFDDEGTFFYIPFTGLDSMAEVFRRRVIKLLVERELLNENFAQNLLSWRHSGFSIDNSVRILDESAQENLAEYIARPPISLKPRYVTNHSRGGFSFTRLIQNTSRKTFTCSMLSISSQSSPSTFRRRAFSSSDGTVSTHPAQKGDGKDMPWVSERAPEGWKNVRTPMPLSSVRGMKCTSFSEDEVEVDILAYKRAWARLLSKVYEIDPLACPKCGAEMKCRDRSSATPAIRPWMSLQLSRTQMRLSEYSDIW
jgi:hypothetical protein